MNFENKTAIITGSSGIALATAIALSKEGAQVHIAGIDEGHNAEAKTAAGKLPITVHKVDISYEAQVKLWIDSIASQSGGIDILINSAGIQTFGNIESTETADWDRVMNINLRSCFLTGHYVYPHMKKRGGGSIIHVSSVQGHSNQNNVLAYATSKGAQQSLTRAMAVDCAKDNIRVNSISPGSIQTPLLEYSAQQLASEDKSVEDMIGEFGQSHPIGRVGSPDEVAALICFLVGEKGGFCVGADYLIDGGLSAQLGV